MNSMEDNINDFITKLPEDVGISTFLLHLKNINKFTDIHFAVTNGESEALFSAHKMVLAIWSPYFAEEFYGSKEKVNNVMKLFDINPDAFGSMLEFMYGSRSNIETPKKACDVYKVAKKFGVNKLMTECYKTLDKIEIKPKNVLDMLEASCVMQNDSTKDRCAKVIQERIKEVSESYELPNISSFKINALIDTLNSFRGNKLELFLWIFAWAKNKFVEDHKCSSTRDALKDFLPKLPFLQLSNVEFAELNRSYDQVLEPDEVSSIFMNIAIPGSKKMPSWYIKGYDEANDESLKQPRHNLLNAAVRSGEASHTVLRNIGEDDAIDKAREPQHPEVRRKTSEPQKALLSTISASRSAVDRAKSDLFVKVQLPHPDPIQWKQNTMDVIKQSVSSQLAALNSATAEVIILTSGPPEEVDHLAVGVALTTIIKNLSEISKDVKIIAALMDDDLQGENLLDAARNLCAAFYDLLKAAEPETKEPSDNLFNAAVRGGEASHAVLRNIGEDDAIDKAREDILLGLAKRVANVTANLVMKAKNVASECDDQAHKNRVNTAATLYALTTTRFIACAKVILLPTITDPNCQQQLIEAAKEVSRTVEGINKACSDATRDEGLLKDMHLASNQVEDALNDLIHHIRTASKKRSRASVHDGAVDTILDATDRLLSSTGDAGEIVRQAKILATATATLVQAIKGEVDSQTDSDMQKRLLAAAKVIADACTKMVKAANGCASNPHDSASEAALQKAAEDLKSATNAAANNAREETHS